MFLFTTLPGTPGGIEKVASAHNVEGGNPGHSHFDAPPEEVAAGAQVR